ncbi:hypothetical protein BG006_008994 [Podila minutissima]|uniref:Uncharacterized protein n=1 Tax=Podila minutissima TaxID=64525 RepID=A0A9P5SF00_9FUNG|nr:hypothetical protein BG006_008994 [Podila minutissima]
MLHSPTSRMIRHVTQTILAAVILCSWMFQSPVQAVMNIPPNHLNVCPDAYLFEFKSAPGGIEAANERRQFEAAISGMKSVTVRQSFAVLLNGVSAQVSDEQELGQLMALDILKMVTPLTVVSPPDQVASTVNAMVSSAQNMTGVTRVQQELGLTGKGVRVGIIAILGAYRVVGCNGSTNDDIILAALERAVEDKMDVINLSIGEPNGWPLNPVTRAIGAAKRSGVMVAVSQGNENTQGLFSVNYIGDSASALSVASFINTKTLLSYFTTSLEPDRRILYSTPSIPGMRLSIPLVAAVKGTELGNACVPFTADIKGKVVMVLRGGCLFADKAKNALNGGAAGIIFVNSVQGSLSVTIDPVKFDFGVLSNTEGLALFEKLSAQGPGSMNVTKEVTASFSDGPEPFLNPAGGSSSSFSSYGLDNELHIKPDLGAPGENIYSTWPTRNGSYTTLSGTSMASPHVAGALALALQHWRAVTGKVSPLTGKQIQSMYNAFRITSTPTSVYKNHEEVDVLKEATTLSSNNEATSWKTINTGGTVTSIAKQGAGMIDVYRGILTMASSVKTSAVSSPATQTIVLPPTIELNDTEFATLKPYRLTIYNNGPEAVTYQLGHIPAEALHDPSIEPKDIRIQELAAGTYNVSMSGKDKDGVVFRSVGADVNIPTSTITVPAKGKRAVAVQITAPSALPVEQHWIYSGYISITPMTYNSQPQEAIYVSYAGVKGRMRDLTIFLRPTDPEIANTPAKSLCQVLGGVVENKTDYVYSLVDKDVPIVTFCVQNPTRYLMLDVISPGTDEVNYEVIGRVGSNEFVPRLMAESIVTTVKWNGKIEYSDGSEESMPRDEPSGHRSPPEAIRREPGMDLIYGMRAVPDGHYNVPYKSEQSRTTKLAERGIEAPTTAKETARGTPTVGLPRANAAANAVPVPVPNGAYRFRLRALKFMGSYEKKEDYDVWISPTFVISRKDG